MNFIQMLIAFLAGWLSALIAVIEGHAIMKPYLDRRLLQPARTPLQATQKLPDATI
jgi:hypothetical protein